MLETIILSSLHKIYPQDCPQTPLTALSGMRNEPLSFQLAYKLEDKGGRLVKVDKYYPSSQICSCCGARHPEMKELKRRVMECQCGNRMDRDHNAAKNIKTEGLRLLPA